MPQPCTGCRVQTSAGYSVTSPTVFESNVCDVGTCERDSKGTAAFCASYPFHFVALNDVATIFVLCVDLHLQFGQRAA